MFIDTHCHLNMMVDKLHDEILRDDHLREIGDIIRMAKDASVMTMINVGTSLEESKNSLMIARRYPEVYASVGIHPCDGSSSWRDAIDLFHAMIHEDRNEGHNRIVAIGETGLDFYHKPYDRGLQEDLFKAHIELALSWDLPVIVHVRDAGDELLYILEPYVRDRVRGVIHCFNQPLDFAQIVMQWGFLLGIDAPITYPKNQPFRDVVAQIPLDAIILETDAPFLPPQIYRGKKNHPAFIEHFAPVLADVHGVSVDELARVTTKNAQSLFQWQ